MNTWHQRHVVKCKNIKQDLKGEKIYNCSECNLVIDRDINAAINIYLL